MRSGAACGARWSLLQLRTGNESNSLPTITALGRTLSCRHCQHHTIWKNKKVGEMLAGRRKRRRGRGASMLRQCDLHRIGAHPAGGSAHHHDRTTSTMYNEDTRVSCEDSHCYEQEP